jgi:hypothetical protein
MPGPENGGGNYMRDPDWTERPVLQLKVET